MRRILFEVHLYTAFRELLRVAKLAAASGRYECTFCLTDAAEATRERVERECAAAGFTVVTFEPAALDTPSAWVERALQRAGANVVALRFRIAREALRGADQLVRTLAPALVVMGEDGVGANRAIITAARRRGIRVVIVPYEYSNAAQPAAALRADADYRREYGMESRLHRALAWWLPRWTYTDHGERLLRSNGTTILVEEALGLAPPLPWVVHGGRADCLAAESSAMRDHYLREGIPADKIRTTGALYHDELRRNLDRRDELRRALAVDPDRRLILCALPPSYVHSRPRCDFTTYSALLRFWIETLLGLDAVAVVFQLHPSITAGEAEEAAALGARIARDDIATLIPACDALVTSVSSIIRMAIACGVPVLNYDVYRFAYPDYDDVPGVATVQERDDFVRIARSLAANDAQAIELRARQAQVAPQWGTLDGRAGARMLALFDELSA